MDVDPASDEKVTPDTVRGQYELARAYRFLALHVGWGFKPSFLRQRETQRETPTGNGRPGSRSGWDFNERHRAQQQMHERSLELVEGLLTKDPRNHHFRLAKATSCRTLASLHGMIARWSRVESAAANARQAEAIAVLESLAEDFANAGQFRHELARALATRMGAEFRGQAERTAKAQQLRRATEIGEQLLNEFPTITAYKLSLAGHCRSLGRMLGKSSEAEGYYRRAAEIGEQLLREFPTVTGYKSSLARHCSSLGARLQSMDKSSEAEGYYRRALQLREELDGLPNASRRSIVGTNRYRLDLARVLIANQKPEEARKELETCLAVVAELRDAEGQSRSSYYYYYESAARRLWSIHRNMANVLRALDKEKQAKDHEKQAEEASMRWGRGRRFGRRGGRRR